jgi:hypothetical protein
VLVTVAPGGRVDRRRIDLIHGLRTHPYHHEESWTVGRYANNRGRARSRSPTSWRSSSSYASPPCAARARVSRRWPRRLLC